MRIVGEDLHFSQQIHLVVNIRFGNRVLDDFQAWRSSIDIDFVSAVFVPMFLFARMHDVIALHHVIQLCTSFAVITTCCTITKDAPTKTRLYSQRFTHGIPFLTSKGMKASWTSLAMRTDILFRSTL